jgi:multiple sugar transport system permease protein
VSVYPLFYGVRASVTHYLYGRDFGFDGLTNYRNVWNDTFFRQAMETTLKYVVLCVAIETVLGLGLALLVSREIRFGGPIRVGLILPMTIAPVVVGVMWRLLFDSGVGVTDPLFQLFGFSPPDVLAHNGTAFASVVLVDVWEWTPLIFLILLAGLQSLPQEPLEAALVDGAGRVRLFFDHTLPLLFPVLLVAIVLRTIDAVGTFDQIYVLTQGGPGTSTRLISIYAYNTAFLFTQYGQAAAMLIALLVMVMLLMVVAVRLMQKTAR